MLRVVMGVAATTAAVVLAPPVSADPNDFQYVTTVSGSVRCVLNETHVGCERTSIDGFPGAPKSASGPGNFNVAGVDSSGAFNFGEGNIGGVDAGEITLTYGQTFRIKGWTVLPGFDGTRFTSDATGHGMFVSIDRVTPF